MTKGITRPVGTYTCSNVQTEITGHPCAATVKLAESLKSKCQLFGYCEIEPDIDRLKWIQEGSRMSTTYEPLADKRLKIVKIHQKEDIWPAFKKLLGKRISIPKSGGSD